MLLTKEQATEFQHKIAEVTAIDQKKPHKALEMYLELWNELPEPKNKNPEQLANWLIYCIFDMYFILGDFIKAKDWAFIALKYRISENDSYEYLLLGKVYYELKEYDNAQKYFDIAWQLGKRRIFQEENKKYWQFYSDNKKKK